MKNLLALCTLLPFFAVASPLEESLKPWEPLEITQQTETIRIVLNERRITNNIYEAIVQNGICMPLWLQKDNEYLEAVKEIEILNQFEKQGFVFENPMESCQKIGDSTEEAANLILMGGTHIF
ncbi:hypothetical protein [Shewanella algae]|uniref:hypothetical protein n=1 Tax=Shewanella algae TaxID=38313 RepID=UPI0031F5A6AC